uniref:tigger transposable element-derived protein 1-like n=1 Tax=Myxine glutinosa TaxID=7769 RepID=UPI00358F3FBF
MADIPRPHPPTIAQCNAAAPAREIKKRNNLTYADKFEIVQLIDNGEAKRSVGKKFGINESTVRSIYQNRDHIKAHMNLALSEAGAQAMQSRNQLLLKTEQLLGRYLERQAKRNLVIDTREIMNTAKDIYAAVARKMGVQQPPVFLASKGWVDKFMSGHKVKSVKISGEAASGDKSAAREYPESIKEYYR